MPDYRTFFRRSASFLLAGFLTAAQALAQQPENAAPIQDAVQSQEAAAEPDNGVRYGNGHCHPGAVP